MSPSRIAAALAFGLALSGAGRAQAAEVKVLASGALKAALGELAADFEKTSGHRATIAYGPAGALAVRIEKGEPADVAIVSRAQLAELEAKAKVAPGSRRNIAGSALGVAIRAGAPKPDLGSVEALKRLLASARSIAYRDPATGSSSGIYTARLLERLGLAQELKPKIRLDSSEGAAPEHVFDSVARGEVELQIGQISEIVIAPGVALAGPLPDEIQNITWLAAGVVAGAKAPDVARAFVDFISSPAAAAVLKAKGFEPG